MWTFSTGVLRGHEGGPLVIGDVMYVHTPFPNNVYALDLNENGQIQWKYEPQQDPDGHPGDVLRHGQPRRGLCRRQDHPRLRPTRPSWRSTPRPARRSGASRTATPKKGETMTSAPMVVKDKVIVGISGGEFGVRGRVTAYNVKDGSKAWRAYSIGPDDQTPDRPQKTTELGKPIGKDPGSEDLAGRPVEDRRRHHLGLVLLRPAAEPDLLRHRAIPAPGTRPAARATTSGR